ncbi:MAG: ATP-binding cassette domain-containing protein [Actinomycetota bacterium]
MRRGDRQRAIREDWHGLAPAASLIVIAGVLSVLPGIVVPLLMRAFLARVLVAADSSWESIITLLGLLLCAAAIGLVVWLQWRSCTLVAVRLSASSSARLVWHLLRIPTGAVDEFGPGDLAARVSALQQRAFQSGLLLPLAFINAVVMVVYAAFLIVLSPVLGSAGLVVIVLSMVASYLLLTRRRALQDASTQAGLALAAETTAIVTEIETIKASAAEQWEYARWSDTNSRLGQASSQLALDGQRLGLVSPITALLGLGTVLAIGTFLVFNGALSLGTFVAIQGVLTALLIPAGQLVWIGVLLEAVASNQRSTDEVLRIPVDTEVTSLGSGIMPVGAPVAVSVHNVTFGYGSPPLFSDLSIDIAPGSWVAVVGGSGSGKSTLARLCVGELQPASGVVLLDGRPRLETPRAWRSSVVGYVPQYPVLVPGSILENIRMFDPAVSEDEVVDALQTACVMDAVERRPSGLQELVGPSGHGFSGGELQRLAIARSLARRPGFLVLDEATSALDPIVEVELDARLRQRSMTCLVVAHRLSTVRDADEIIVIEAGRIEQRGHFDELRHSGRFKELVHG